MSDKILINEVYPNPESGSEWIELYTDQEPNIEFSLANFTLSDSVRQIYKFTNEKFINQLLVIEVTGLNNDTDSVVLKDNDGNILDAFTYEHTEKGLSWSKNIDGNFILSTPSPNLDNPVPTLTLTPTTTSTPTVQPSAISTTTPTPNIIPYIKTSDDGKKTNTAPINNTDKSLIQHLINLDQIKLFSNEEASLNRNTKLVFIGESLERNLIINAIIGSFLIILGSLIFIYGKIKNQHRS